MTDTEELELQFKALKKQRTYLKGRLTNLLNYVNSIDASKLSDAVIAELSVRDKQVEATYNEFQVVQGNIVALVDDQHIQEELDTREQFDSKYYMTAAKYEFFLRSNRGNSNTNHECNNVAPQVQVITRPASIKLPEIPLPNFNGNYECWMEFRDTYESLIHRNASISDMQKFHYLRAALKGEAALTLASIEFSAENYGYAWKILCNRFNNPRILVHNHIKALFSFPRMQKESAVQIRTLLDNLAKHLCSLASLNEPTSHWDTLLIYIITSGLDSKTMREWEESLSSDITPSLDQLTMFLKNKADLLEAIEFKRDDSDSASKHFRSQRFQNKNSNNTRTFATTTTARCLCCNGTHGISNCSDFHKLSTVERYNKIKEWHCCMNCLNTGHMAFNCKSSHCRKCGRRHHSLLHHNYNKAQSSASSSNMPVNIVHNANENEVPAQATTVSHTARSTNDIAGQVVLATALVLVRDSRGSLHNARALLDSGSQSSFVTLELVKRLNLEQLTTDIRIEGIQLVKSAASSMCKMELLAHSNNYCIKSSFLILPRITGQLPTYRIDTKQLEIPAYLQLADPSYNIPGPIDILLGADHFWSLLAVGQHALGNGKPVLQKTQLGWILSGALATSQHKTICNLALNEAEHVDDILTKFWKIEEVDQPENDSDDTLICEKHFIATTKRDETGRFIVNIPTQRLSTLGESYNQALTRFHRLEHRLNSNMQLKSMYSSFINEYIQLGHMREVANDSKLFSQPHFFLPHHPVFNEASTTTKLRVVFDGSAKTTSGVSLNNCQRVGPVVQDDLFSILLRFRKYKYAITADIPKFYRQVLVETGQRPLQRILWRENASEQIRIFELSTVTYGTAAAAFLATRTLKALAETVADKNPDVAERLIHDFYVDDLNTGTNNWKDAIALCENIRDALRSAGMDLRKWTSNDPRISNHFSTSPAADAHQFDENAPAKTLGLFWVPNIDSLTFKIGNFDRNASITKRQVLSMAAQVFDPLGLLSPCTICAKMFMQRLWQLKISWDETLPQGLHTEWLQFRSALLELNTIKIPRHCLLVEAREVYLHGFADASERAYGACMYIVCCNEDGASSSHLLCAKTKVAPVKTLSIPRLELCAAHLLSKLMQGVIKSMGITFDKCFLWSDSTVVLSWLQHDANQLKTFVANRVATIQVLSKNCTWRHVPTAQNPADMLSRGISPGSIRDNNLWWQGPEWLVLPMQNWPVLNALPPVNLEYKQNNTCRSLAVTILEPILQFENYSSFSRLERVVAHVQRFIKHSRSANENRLSHLKLTLEETRSARYYIIKTEQSRYFSEYIHDKRKLSKSHLASLFPFVDEMGILRVGGRLRNSQLAYGTRHPILLPNKSHIARLIFEHEHRKQLHIGPQGLLNCIRQKYWPLNGRNLAKAVVHSCMQCFKARPKQITPQMGQLPAERVTPTYAFYNCGVDYAGPFDIKTSNLRGNRCYKAYISVFVCMTTRAIHLELVTGLSTERFIATLRRFIARRGVPTKIFSDNGSNFKGTSNELKRFFAAKAHAISAAATSEGVTWNFIPPRSPHFGGIWEAGVKSVKHHLNRSIGLQKLSYEDFTTFLYQVEAVLNSRPLSPLSSDPHDFTPLTPAHFLIGRPLTSVLDEPIEEERVTRLSRFQHIQRMTQQFWIRWRKDYVNQLQQASKWTKEATRRLKLGDLVLIADDNSNSLRWKLGRITILHPGRDGIVRVATLKTADGAYQRAVHRICPLPSNDEATTAALGLVKAVGEF